MKYLAHLLIFILCCSPALFAQDWQLVWSDEFDYTGLPDSSKWSCESGMLRNHEDQYYTKNRLENARVQDGKLMIQALKEPWEGAKYTSASLLTRGKASWTYGRIEVRAKLPTGRGTWPAIWMLGTNIRQVHWPMCGEIDIMENVGYDPDVIWTSVHTEAFNHVKKTGKNNHKAFPAPYDQFYVYAIEWYKDRIDFFVNDEKMFTYTNDEKGDPETWPFDKPQYLILNLAIGGAWGGQQGIDDSLFPHTYEIDYVRVYRDVSGQ